METLKRAKHWLRLLLDTSPRQASALLATADARQVRALVEIIHNALHNPALPIPERLRRRFLRQRRWKNLDKKSWRAARAIIKMSELKVLTLLHALREVILDLLKK